MPSTDSWLKWTENLQDPPKKKSVGKKNILYYDYNYLPVVFRGNHANGWLAPIPHYPEDRQTLRMKLQEALESEEELRRQVPMGFPFGKWSTNGGFLGFTSSALAEMDLKVQPLGNWEIKIVFGILGMFFLIGTWYSIWSIWGLATRSQIRKESPTRGVPVSRCLDCSRKRPSICRQCKPTSDWRRTWLWVNEFVYIWSR